MSTKLPTVTIPVTFTIGHAPGWKSGYLSMKMGGGEVSHNGKRLGRFSADAFSGAPVVEIDGKSGDGWFSLTASGNDIFAALYKEITSGNVVIPGPGFDPVGEDEKKSQ